MNRINTALATLALSFAAAGTAFADDITLDTATHASLKTRAEVQQELAQFKKGANPWSSSYNVNAQFKSERSRTDVRSEVLAARASGELAALASEDSGSAYLAQQRQAAPTVTRIASR